MKRLNTYFMSITSLVVLLFMSTQVVANTKDKTVLMIVSGNGKVQGQEAPGYEFDEFAKAYLVFKAHDMQVDIASPRGGVVEADKYDANKDYIEQVLNDQAIMAKLNDTLSTSQLDAQHYDAIFIVGGKGAMFDLPNDLPLQKLIADIYQQQGTVAAVCHGPAALVDVTLDDGSYLLANKVVNAFTNAEERLFGQKWLPKFAFMLEDKLIERGGTFQSSPIMLNHVAIDGRLITGQNPTSTVAVATELVKSLGITPVKMAQYQDDITLNLVATFLAGDDQIEQALASAPELYNLKLVGMYGLFYLKTADNDHALRNALTLMKIGQTAINNPRLDIEVANTQHKLGDIAAAKTTLQSILAHHPDFVPAKDMLDTLLL